MSNIAVILRWFVMLLCIVVIDGCATYPKLNVSKSQLSPEQEQRVIKHIREKMNSGDITGLSVTLLNRKDVLWSGDFGFANKANQKISNERSMYRIGSMTKLFTATAILQLNEQGLLSVDDPVSKYIPALKIASCYDGYEITVAQLLTHQSGLPHSYEPEFWTSNDWRSVAAKLRCDMVPYRPGLIISYSNVGYTLLGNIIEKVSGQTYDHYIEDNILKPLNMRDVAFQLQGQLYPAKYAKRISSAYDLSGIETKEPVLRDLPAGGMYATTAALSKFLRYFLSNYAQSDSGVFRDRDTRTQVLSPQGLDNASSMDIKIGWGWFLSQSPDGSQGYIAQHDGSNKYHHGRVLLSPMKGVGIVLLANSGSREILQSLGKDLFMDLIPSVNTQHETTVASTESTQANFCAAENIPGYYYSELGLVKVEAQGKDYAATINGTSVMLNSTQTGYFNPSKQLLGFIHLGKSVFGDLQISFRCSDGFIFAAVKDSGGEFPLAFRVYSKDNQLDNKWMGRYVISDAEEPSAYIRVWREDGEILMESEHLPVSNSKKTLLLTALNSHQARTLYLADKWGPLINFSESPSGMLASYKGFTFVKTDQ